MSTRKRKAEDEELVALPSDESEEEEEWVTILFIVRCKPRNRLEVTIQLHFTTGYHLSSDESSFAYTSIMLEALIALWCHRVRSKGADSKYRYEDSEPEEAGGADDDSEDDEDDAEGAEEQDEEEGDGKPSLCVALQLFASLKPRIAHGAVHCDLKEHPPLIALI